VPEWLAAIALVVAVWAAFVVVLWVHRPTRDTASALVTLVPDLALMVYRLARDPSTPTRYRAGLIVLGAYLALPIDVVPDFLPVVGALDDVILVAVVLRWVARGVGGSAIERAWTGSPRGLAIVRAAAGLEAP
jgi:uncharacterized membrane protein YkvA (DUF1232 family)